MKHVVIGKTLVGKNQKACFLPSCSPVTPTPYIYITATELKLKFLTHGPKTTWVVPQTYPCLPQGNMDSSCLINRSSSFLLCLETIEIQVSETIPHPYNPNARRQDLQAQQWVDMDKEPSSACTSQIPWSAFGWEGYSDGIFNHQKWSVSS